MSVILRQSTAATLKYGPVVDATDATPETAWTIQKADLRHSVNGGNMAAMSADQGVADAGAPHDELGFYDVSADTTDTATLGNHRVAHYESGTLVSWMDFSVVTAAAWDSLFGGNGDGHIIASGTIGATGNDTTHLHLDGLTYGDDELNEYGIVVYDDSTGEAHFSWITDWVLSTELATVATLPFTPEASVDRYQVLAIKRNVTAASAANLETALQNYSATRGLSGTALPAAAADAAGGLVISDAGGLDIDAQLANLYSAQVVLDVDAGGSGSDEYTVVWYKNGVPVTSGITLPTIQVVKRADGTDLVASTAMTQIGSTGAYKYDEATNKITAGEAVLVLVGATIDGSGRTARVAIRGRDTVAA